MNMPSRVTRSATAALPMARIDDGGSSDTAPVTLDEPGCQKGVLSLVSPSPLSLSLQPALWPFQLTDEMYARILRNPERFGYPTLPPGTVKAPKFGHIFVEARTPGVRRPKLVDGFDWVPSSTANASTRTLADGVTELLRYYCARRTKSDAAKPPVKPFTLYQRDVYNAVKASQPKEATTYQIKKAVGERWRALEDSARSTYIIQARKANAQSRQRMATADPAQLLVRHEMCETPAASLVFRTCRLTARCCRPHFSGGCSAVVVDPA